MFKELLEARYSRYSHSSSINLPNTLHSATAAPPIPPWKVADPFPGPISMVQDGSKQTGGPKQLYIVTTLINLFGCYNLSVNSAL